MTAREENNNFKEVLIIKAKVTQKILAMMLAASTIAATPGLAAGVKDKFQKNTELHAASSDGDEDDDVKDQKMLGKNVSIPHIPKDIISFVVFNMNLHGCFKDFSKDEFVNVKAKFTQCLGI